MIVISPSISIDDRELQFDFIRASGPGGQNVNKVSTSVQLRFDVRNTPALNQDTKERLMKLAGSRMTEGGILILEAKRHRTQEANRLDAIDRLTVLIRQALEKPKPRRPTRPTHASQEKRLAAKRKRSGIKRNRQTQPHQDE